MEYQKQSEIIELSYLLCGVTTKEENLRPWALDSLCSNCTAQCITISPELTQSNLKCIQFRLIDRRNEFPVAAGRVVCVI